MVHVMWVGVGSFLALQLSLWLVMRLDPRAVLLTSVMLWLVMGARVLLG